TATDKSKTTEVIPESDTLNKGQKNVPVTKKARSSKKKPIRKLTMAIEEDSEETIEEEPPKFNRLKFQLLKK
ncbi:hypothetical protein A2U01_0046392, partial [Trifolium medium]|nr:hypothetical protein [Trifolium medium]